jgi:hypothetical protein
MGMTSATEGYAEFVVPADPGYAMFGLSHGDTDWGYVDIDFAFYTYPPTGQLMVFENGTYRGTFGTYAAGDALRVAVAAGVVTYWRNGAVIFTSSQGPVYPLRVDTALYSTGAVVQDATLAGTLVSVVTVIPTEAVTWQKEVGVSATPTTLTKTAATGWGNGGASSTRAIGAGSDGYAEFTVPTDPGYAMFGLSHGDSDQGYADLDFAFYTYPPTGQLMVFENGGWRGTFGSYAAGQTLRVSVESNVVRYSRAGAIIYTSVAVPTYPLRVDTSLYSTAAVVQGATVGGTNLVDVLDTLPAEAVVWQHAVGVSWTATTLTKTADYGWGNGGASSTKAIAAGTDGSAAFTIPADPGYAMFGLSQGDPDQGYADLDFAFYTYPPTGQLMVFENGVWRTTIGPYAAGDNVKVGVEANVVRYYRNGHLVYTSSQSPTGPLRVDTSLYSTWATVADATLAGNSLVDVTDASEPSVLVWQVQRDGAVDGVVTGVTRPTFDDTGVRGSHVTTR